MRLLTSMAFSMFILTFVFCAISGQADTIKLGNGQVIEGKIVEDAGEYIRVMDAAGFISKYPRLEIEAINPADVPAGASADAAAQPAPSQQQPQTQSVTQGSAVAGVREQMQENLKQTEAMVQDTLKRLYALPEYQNTFGAGQEEGTGQSSGNVTAERASDRLRLDWENKNKGRKHKKDY